MNDINNEINQIFMEKRKILYGELDELTKKKQTKYVEKADAILRFVEHVIKSITKPYYRSQEIDVQGDVLSFYTNANANSIAMLSTRGVYIELNFTAKDSLGMQGDFSSLDAEETINSILKDNGIDIEINEDKDENENIISSSFSIVYVPVLVNDISQTKK